MHVDGSGDDRVSLGVGRAHPLSPVLRRLDTGRQVGVRLAGAREHLDIDRERRAAELREPRTPFRDEVEREPVRPGRDRRPDARRHPGALSRLEGRQGRAEAVPQDRVAAEVEPVVREEDRRAEADGARVRDLDARLADRARVLRVERPLAPCDRERSV